MEESCILRLESSSTSASILVDDRQVSRLRRPRIPCRALTFSSSSRAGASKSIVKGRWHTGQSGYIISQPMSRTKGSYGSRMNTYGIIQGRVQILFNALSVEDVVALSLDSVFDDIITKPANSSFTKFLVALESFCIRLALKHEVRMTSHLSHACKPKYPVVNMRNS